MAEPPGNQTPDTPEVSETELRGTKVDALREEATRAGVDGASSMRKEELVQAVGRSRAAGEATSGAPARRPAR